MAGDHDRRPFLVPEKLMIEDQDLLSNAATDWLTRTGRNGKPKEGRAALDLALRHWQPLVPLLVAEPGSQIMRSVMAIPGIRVEAQASLVGRVTLTLKMLCVALALMGCLTYLHPGPLEIKVTSLTTAIFVFTAQDYFLILRNIDALEWRSNYILTMYREGGPTVIGCALLMLTAGFAQLAMQEFCGGYDSLILKFGSYYPAINSGEWWRLLIGPFFHSSLMHWLANSILLISSALLCIRLKKAITFITFVLGLAIGPAISSILATKSGYDSYVGISAGIFSILGLCFGVALHGRTLPRRFAVTVGSLAAVNLFAAAVLDPRASTVGHVCGFGLGVAVSFFAERFLAQSPSAA